MLSLDATVHILWLGTPVAACVSGACVLTAIGGSSWLTSEERIPNPSYRNGSSKVEYLTKCTVSGLFTLCATEDTVLKSVGYFLTAAVLLGVAEVLCLNGHCCRRRRFFTFVSGIIFVVAGLVMMLGVVIYIATLKGEVGDKLRPRSSFQPPRFTYSYGWCFLLLMLGFVTTETAGITAIFLYIYWH
ncbi:Voltage-dependent calcium channel gamma-7 subunit-like, partial [Homarus americanus]